MRYSFWILLCYCQASAYLLTSFPGSPPTRPLDRKRPGTEVACLLAANTDILRTSHAVRSPARRLPAWRAFKKSGFNARLQFNLSDCDHDNRSSHPTVPQRFFYKIASIVCTLDDSGHLRNPKRIKLDLTHLVLENLTH